MGKPIIKEILCVAAGGALGASMRFGTNQLVFELLGDQRFFTATAVENVLGCFLIGLIFTLLGKRAVKYRNLNLFLLTGIIGSYTTYSGYMIDALFLFDESVPLFLIYIFGQLILGLIAVIMGISLVNRIISRLDK